MSIGRVAAFDIETVPDADLLRQHYSDPDAPDDAIVERAQADAIARSGGSDFLPLAFHKVAAISLLFREANKITISSKRPPEHSEPDAIAAFFGLIDRFSPQLVSWNGSGFDLPVLHLRAMRYSVVAANYWQGPGNRYEQYTSRYTDNHLDVMDRLAAYQPRSFTKLDTAALACGLPGKMGTDGSAVYGLWQAGKFKEIADYCETDVLNTYLLWLRFMLIAGRMERGEYDAECERLAAELASSGQDHLAEFHDRWVAAGDPGG